MNIFLKIQNHKFFIEIMIIKIKIKRNFSFILLRFRFSLSQKIIWFKLKKKKE